jgi:hypothetical protein
MSLRRAGAIVGACFVISCGGGGAKGSGFAGKDGSVPDGTTPNMLDGGFNSDAPVFNLGDGTGGDGNNVSALGCSGDLQNVVDQSGNVIMACPPDQGCAAGMCIPACQAAAANHGTIGCDFVQATPSFCFGDSSEVITPPCWAVFIANNWGKAVNITVSYAGTSYPVSGFGRIPVAGQPETSWATVPSTGLPVGEVAVMFMSSDPNSANGTPLTCPVPDAINMGTAVYNGMASDTATGKTWHLVTDVPVTAYDILPYGGAKSFLPSAELLIPTTAWGTNYIAVVPLLGVSTGSILPPGPQWGQIVAATDNTVVKIVPTVALPSGTGVVAAPQNMVTSFTLNAGEVLQWQDSKEMSGSVISASQPIGFNGGNDYVCYTSMTSAGGGCDSAHQQILPISALGSEYVAPPYTTRRADLMPESIPYRIVGTVAGTTLSYDPAVSGAPVSLGQGQVADFESTVAFTVKSQDANHPFYVGQIMPGCMVTGGSRPGSSEGCLGDEEFVNIMPPAQFLSKYIFFTDPTYATTNLVFVREKGTTGFQDVSLDCSGTLTGWTAVGTSGKYEITNIDLIRANIQNGTCNNGPHTAKSNGPFGLMVWGLDSYASYAYPAGGNVAPINTVVVPPVPN